jgi:hypothetical protein
MSILAKIYLCSEFTFELVFSDLLGLERAQRIQVMSMQSKLWATTYVLQCELVS